MRTLATLALAATLGTALSTAALAQSRDFDLAGFDRIDIATGLDAVVTLGDEFSIRAESRSQEALDNLELGVTGGVLTARIEQNFLDFIISGGLVGLLLSSGNAVTLNITLPALAGASASSGADIALPDFSGERLELDASSGADIRVTGASLGTVVASSSSGSGIELSGTAERIELEASSGADIDAEDLLAVDAMAEASSGSNISLHATGRIRADASSGGDVDVHGNPAEREFDASSGGDVSFND